MAEAVTTTTITELPVGDVRPGSNDRTSFDAAGIAELAASISTHGLAQPITVRPVGNTFEIVAGERRHRAVCHLGLPTIAASIREYDDRTAAAVMLVENVQRADLDPVDEAHAYQSRIDRFGLTVGEVAAMAGVTVARVATRLPILRLFGGAQDLVRIGQLSVNHAKVMADLDGNRQRLALRALAKNLTYFEFRDLCQRLLNEQCAETMFDADAFLELDAYVADAKAGRTKPSYKRLVEMLRNLAGQVADLPDDVVEALDALQAVAA